MRTNVIDLIIQMARHIRAGESLEQLSPGELKQATKSETAAAYSWIMQKAEAGRIQQAHEVNMLAHVTVPDKLPNFDDSVESRTAGSVEAIRPKPYQLRVLHAAERSVISTDAYGYLIELYNIGVLDENNLESLIENAMMGSYDKISKKTVKEMVAALIFGRFAGGPNRILLHGSETVN
jgi:hypothetical protein